MKKDLFKFGILFWCFGVMSGCDGDTTYIQEQFETGTIRLEQQSVHFRTDGGKKTFVLDISPEVTGWDIETELSRILIKDIDKVNNSFTVEMDYTEEIEDFEGSVIIYADNARAATIQVTQAGWGIVHDRPTAKRFKINGPIKHATMHGEPVVPRMIYDLHFNEGGWLTHYNFIIAPESLFEVDIIYDNQNRVKTIRGGSGNMWVGDEPVMYELEFEYGDHGNYMEIEHPFRILHGWGAYIHHETWLSPFVKDLTRIKCYFSGMLDYQRMDFVYHLDGNTGKIMVEFDNYYDDAAPMEALNFTLDSYGYSSTNRFNYRYGENAVDQLSLYRINPKNGNILATSVELAEGGMAHMQTTREDNLWNTITYEMDGNTLFIFAYYFYNEYWDLIEAVDLFGGSMEFEYEYDQYMNWVRVNDYERTLEYYE